MLRRKKNKIFDYFEENKIGEKKGDKAEEVVLNEIETYIDDGVTCIKGSFTNDLDISQLSVLVLQSIQETKERFIPILRDEYKEESQLLKQKYNSLTVIEIKEKEELLKDIEEKLEGLKDIEERYQAEVSEIIREYKELETETETETDTTTEYDILSDEFKTRYALIQNYLKIVNKNYIPINITLNISYRTPCLCEKPPKTFISLKEGCKLCPNCNMEIAMLDTNRTSAIPKSNYDDWGNFNQAIQYYQGTQVKELPPTLEDELNAYFKKHGQMLGKEIRDLPRDERGRKPHTSRSLMVYALQGVNYPNMNDVSLIMANYWGWQLPNLTRYMETLQQMFERSRILYNKYKGHRKSALGTQYRLYQMLFHLGFDVDETDFKLVMTPELKRDYNTIWGKIAEELEWKWKPL